MESQPQNPEFRNNPKTDSKGHMGENLKFPKS